jgi:polysaccharide export outer membrane protein
MVVRHPSILFVALAWLLVGCNRPPGPAALRGDPNQPGLTADGRANVGSDYVIGPGDTLSIFVYRLPELSTDLPVRPDGKLSMPLISDLVAAGKTPTQLGKEIETRLKEYVREPTVTVMVRSFVGPTNRQIRIIGEAVQPRALPYRDGMTVMDVLIAAGGLTRYAAGNRADLVRRDPTTGAMQTIRLRLSDLVRNGDISQDVQMQPGDTLMIPQSWF